MAAGIKRQGGSLSGRTACVLLLLLGSSAVPAFCSAAAQTASIAPSDQVRYQKAMEAVNRGDAAVAQPLLEDLHRRYPGNFAVNESLGLIYAAQNHLNLALPLMKAAAAEQPDSDAAWVNLGIACMELKRNAEAAQALARAVQLNPHSPRAHEALGQVWMQAGQSGKAAAAFERAVAAGGSGADLLYNAALASFESGDAGRAALLLARMPGADTSAAAQSLYGDVEEKLGHYKDAGQHYIDAARLEPSEANEYMLGVEFLRHWTFDPAAREFAAALQRFPESRRLRMGLGIAFFGERNYPKAIEAFAALLAADPESETNAELLGRACSVLTEGSDPHCAALAAFAEKHPQDGKIATDAAISILNQPADQHHLEAAERLLDQAIQATPHLEEAHYQKGLLLQDQSHWQQSIPELETALRLKPDDAAAHYRLALALARTGSRERAQQEIALQKKYSAQENKDRDERLSQMQTLLVTMR